jgi:hypothetical protein
MGENESGILAREFVRPYVGVGLGAWAGCDSQRLESFAAKQPVKQLPVSLSAKIGRTLAIQFHHRIRHAPIKK